MFDRLVWTVVGYGVEIWEWEEREGVERLEERDLRWLMGVGPRIWVHGKGRIVEGKIEGQRGEKGYERRLEEGKRSGLGRECREEMREIQGRKKFFEERGIGIKEWENREGEGLVEELMKRDKKKQRKERWERIRNSKFNKWYKEVKGEGIPEYLKKGWGKIGGGE